MYEDEYINLRSQSDAIRFLLQALEVKIEKQLEDAERAQRNIYMQLVPDELSRVPPKQVVHPHDPAEHLNSPQQWFDEIVPDAVTRHLSKCDAPQPLGLHGMD